MPDDFPETYPEVTCTTEIYHPNIDPTSDGSNNVCLSLFDEWDPNFGIRDVIQGLLFLFYNPNVDDPLSSYFGDALSEGEFEANVRASLRGEDVEGYEFPWNYHGNDPDMLKCKPTPKAQKIEVVGSETVSDEQNTGDRKDVENPENDTKAENTGTSTTEVNSENSEEKEEETKKTDNNDDKAIVNSDTEAQDVNVILEKVSELMVQHPEVEGDKTEGENTENEETRAETAGRVEENTDDRNYFVNTDSTEDNADNNENDPIGAATNNDVNRELGNNDGNAVGPTNCPFQRQNSKLERQGSMKEPLTETPAKEMSSTPSFFHFYDAFRTSNFDTPEYDFTMNMFGAACFFVYKSFVK